MTHMKLAQILQLIRPQAQWCLRGDTLAELEWLDPNQVVPTQAEIDAGEIQIDALAYKDLRKAEYPYYGDQLDAIWKMAQVLTADGITLGADALDMIAAVNAVKAKYPKPS